MLRQLTLIISGQQKFNIGAITALLLVQRQRSNLADFIP
jgi:hypothetical protein